MAERACQRAKKSKEKQDEVKGDKNLLGYPTTDENRHTFKGKTRTPDDIPLSFYWKVGFYLKVVNSSALRRKSALDLIILQLRNTQNKKIYYFSLKELF